MVCLPLFAGSPTGLNSRGIARLGLGQLVFGLVITTMVVSLAVVDPALAQDPPLDTTNMDGGTFIPPPPPPSDYDNPPMPGIFPIRPEIINFVLLHPTPHDWLIAGQVIDVDGPTDGLIVELNGAAAGTVVLTMADGFFCVHLYDLPWPEGYIGAVAFDVTGLPSVEVGEYYE